MKCRLARVVDNYYILLTDAQYYGLELYKRRFGGDEWVEKQFNLWFHEGHVVDLSRKEFLKISGLTYFAPVGVRMALNAHVKTAVNMTANTGAKKRKKSGPGPKPKPKPGSKPPPPDTPLAKTLDQEVKTVIHNTDTAIEVRDVVPEKGQGAPSDEALKERTIIKADDGNSMIALTTWLAGTYLGHAMSKFGWRRVYDVVSNASEIGAFTHEQVRTFFASPWMYHPDTHGQILEVFNTVAPLHEKVTNALGKAQARGMLESITATDIYRIITKGDTALLSGGQTAREVMGNFKITEFVKKYMDGDMEIVHALRGVGKYHLRRANPARVTNAITSYLHFDPARKIEAMSTMLYEAISWDYIRDVFGDYSPEFLKDVVAEARARSPGIAQIIDARAALGDQKAQILREKVRYAVGGTLVGTVGTAIQVYRMGANAGKLTSELKKYGSGEDSRVKMALVKLIVEGDHAYHIAHYAMVGALELMGAGAAVTSGVAVSTFVGGTAAPAYFTSMAVRSVVNTSVRSLLGMGDTVELLAAKSIARMASTLYSVANSTVNLGYNSMVKIGNEFAGLVGKKRQRASVEDAEENVKKMRKAIEENDIQTAVKIHKANRHNRHFRLYRMIHI